jgi:tubulin monoglycylase TTLL3/8
MSKKKDLDYVNLLDNQIINHFNENKAITAKFGLTRNIRNIVILGKDHNQFFPRCYDVNDVKEL